MSPNGRHEPGFPVAGEYDARKRKCFPERDIINMDKRIAGLYTAWHGFQAACFGGARNENTGT